MANPETCNTEASPSLLYSMPSMPEPTHSKLLCGRLQPSSSPSPPSSSSPPPLPPSLLRLWRPEAQKNLREQWSKLSFHRQQWLSLSSSGRSYATSLVNSFLYQSYMYSMELGVLSDMPNIRKKACYKLFKHQEMQCTRLLSSYKDMVATVIHMIQTSGSMRCFSQGARGSSLVDFSTIQVDPDDTGDGGGIPVSTFWSISTFEELAQQLVEMFKMELVLKRLLVVGLLSISCGKTGEVDKLSWSDELYPGETDDLSTCNMYSKETCSAVFPRVKGWSSNVPDLHSNKQAEREVLQVHITTWLAEVNADTDRFNEIFAMVGEEIRVNLS